MPEEDWIDFAIQRYIEENYEKINKDYRDATEKSIIDDNPKFVLSEKDGKSNISLLYGISAISYESKTLYDEQFDAILNNYPESIPIG